MIVDAAIAGKIALVTGASSGIGNAIAQGLSAEGAQLWLVGRDLEKLKSAVPAVSLAGVLHADFRDPQQVEFLAGDLARRVGTLDILIHSAGIISFGLVEDAAPADLDDQWQVNLRAPYVLTQRLLPLLKKSRGQVVFVNSSAGRRAVDGASAYSASKHALKGLADSLRAEVNAHGVRVLSLFVGRTATPMQAAVLAHEGRSYDPENLIQPAEVASVVVHALSLSPTVEVTAIQMRPARPSR